MDVAKRSEIIGLIDKAGSGGASTKVAAASELAALLSGHQAPTLLEGDDGNPVVFYHGGAEVLDLSVAAKGRFGALFVRQGSPSGYGSKQHKFNFSGSIAEDRQLEDALSGDLDAVRKHLRGEADDDLVERIVEEMTNGSHYPTDEDIWGAIGAIDEADAQEEIQRLKIKVARDLGYDAVRISDEFDGETVAVMAVNKLIPIGGDNA